MHSCASCLPLISENDFAVSAGSSGFSHHFYAFQPCPVYRIAVLHHVMGTLQADDYHIHHCHAVSLELHFSPADARIWWQVPVHYLPAYKFIAPRRQMKRQPYGNK